MVINLHQTSEIIIIVMLQSSVEVVIIITEYNWKCSMIVVGYDLLDSTLPLVIGIYLEY